MQTEYLIVGQGISGSWLTYYLEKEKRSFLVIDKYDKFSSSAIAAGVINPVTGRRHVNTWMAEEIMPFVSRVYKELGLLLGIEAISQKNLLDFFPNPQMLESFQRRIEENSVYLHNCTEKNEFAEFFHYDFGCGEISPVYTVHLDTLLPAWRKQLLNNQQLVEETFNYSLLDINQHKIKYKDIEADKIIFCDGVASASNPWFRQLPFAPNKGELLIVEIPGLPPHHIYKKGMMLVPLSTPGLFWAGSDYKWEFNDPDPTPSFRNKMEKLLKSWLKIPFKVVDHLAGIRPATLERRPFVGSHPQFPSIAILNGMGTKGCSLAPYFARQLTNHFINGTAIDSEADVCRYSKILAREFPL